VTDLDALIREVHEMWGEPYGEVSALMFRLADALETLRAERDAALAREAKLSPPAAEPDDEKLLYASDVAAEMFGPPAAEPEPGEAGVLSSASAPVGSEAQPQGSEPAAEPEASRCPECGELLELGHDCLDGLAS
jgi:hypothetical protein